MRDLVQYLRAQADDPGPPDPILLRTVADEIERLQAAKRAALKVADTRVKENVELRKENERLRAELKEARDERP